MSRISVIVPVYNAEKYIDRCIQSIIAQTHTNLEIILVNDSSPDNSGAICDEWAKKDDRIRVIHKPNGGVSSARNAGLDAATGEYVAFIDCDDYVMPNWLNDMFTVAKKTNADIVKSGIYYVPEVDVSADIADLDYNLTAFKTIQYKNELVDAKTYFSRLLNCVGYNAVWNQLVKSEIHKKCLFPEEHLNEDYHIFFQLLSCSNMIAITDSIGYCWGQRQDSQSKNPSKEYIVDIISDFIIHHNKAIALYNNSADAKTAIVRATEIFFYHLACSQHLDLIKSELTKKIWHDLYSVTQNYNMKLLLSKMLYLQYKIYSISDELYYIIMCIKKVISK